MFAANPTLTELESVAVTRRPSAVVVRIASGQGNRPGRAPEIPSVIGVVVSFAIDEFVSCSGTVLDAESVGVFTIGALVVVVVGFATRHDVVFRAPFDVETGVAAGMRRDVGKCVVVSFDANTVMSGVFDGQTGDRVIAAADGDGIGGRAEVFGIQDDVIGRNRDAAGFGKCDLSGERISARWNGSPCLNAVFDGGRKSGDRPKDGHNHHKKSHHDDRP